MRSARVRSAKSVDEARHAPRRRTKKRSAEVQTWPERWKAAVTAPAAATSSGAWAVTIIGSLPPASITQGFIRSAQATATALPAATEPVKATAWVRSEAISAWAGGGAARQAGDQARPAARGTPS